MSKKHIRNRIRKERNQLDKATVLAGGQDFARLLLQHPLYQKSQHIAFYWPYQNEVDTRAAINACLEAKKACYLPVITAEKWLIFTPYTSDMTMRTNCFDIMEPTHINPIAHTELDLVIMPAVAIDHDKNRIGMGAGFYDITFQALRNTPKPYLIAAVYSFQIIGCIDKQAHDIPCDDVIVVHTTN